jgi:hypothetical protein
MNTGERIEKLCIEVGQKFFHGTLVPGAIRRGLQRLPGRPVTLNIARFKKAGHKNGKEGPKRLSELT